MKTYSIPFNRPFLAGKELYYIAQSVLSGHTFGDGQFTKKCQIWLEKRVGCQKSLLCVGVKV
jgi:dTDP-4-amino-4,6-dideoxygalactose transaminase